MTDYLKKLFLLPADPEALRQEQITHAKLMALVHRAAAEREEAMATMLDKQAERLAAGAAPEIATTFK